jgi:predicted transposase/invertase (TIGR01784 family)
MEKLIRFDWAIKKLLRNKANFDILEGFLNALLQVDVTIINILESESNQEDEADKFNRVDLLVENAQHDLIIIEVQIKSEQDFFHRIAYGTSKLLTQYLEKSKPYKNIKKVISISVVYFDLGVGTDYLYYGSTNFVGVHNKDVLSLTQTQTQLFGEKEIQKIFPEYYLIRIGQFTDKIREAIDEWIYLLKHDEIKPEFKSKNIQHASEKLRVMNLDKEQREAYEKFVENMSHRASLFRSFQQGGRLEGREEGREEGRKEGREERTIAFVKNSLQQGLELTVISAITGLSAEKIQKIQIAYL